MLVRIFGVIFLRTIANTFNERYGTAYLSAYWPAKASLAVKLIPMNIRMKNLPTTTSCIQMQGLSTGNRAVILPDSFEMSARLSRIYRSYPFCILPIVFGSQSAKVSEVFSCLNVKNRMMKRVCSEWRLKDWNNCSFPKSRTLLVNISTEMPEYGLFD